MYCENLCIYTLPTFSGMLLVSALSSFSRAVTAFKPEKWVFSVLGSLTPSITSSGHSYVAVQQWEHIYQQGKVIWCPQHSPLARRQHLLTWQGAEWALSTWLTPRCFCGLWTMRTGKAVSFLVAVGKILVDKKKIILWMEPDNRENKPTTTKSNK